MIKKVKVSVNLIADFLWTNIKWHFFGSIATVLGTGLLFLMTAMSGCDGGSCGIVFIVVIPIFLILFMSGFVYACARLASHRGTWPELVIGILIYAIFLLALARLLKFLDRDIYKLLEELCHSWLPGFVEAICAAIVISGIGAFIWQRYGGEASLVRRIMICLTVVLAALGVFVGLLSKFLYPY